MRILVTAGPTRQYIDTVRFITNASSGRMGFAVAAAAARTGHHVTLLAGPVNIPEPQGCEVVSFVTVADLKGALGGHFGACDALVMTAAVGDFAPREVLPAKLSRRAGAVNLLLEPTEDLLAWVSGGKQPDQRVVAFAVEDGPPEQIEAKARRELAAKGADYVVLNTPEAIGADESEACILTAGGTALARAVRTKDDLAAELIRILEQNARAGWHGPSEAP